MIIYKITNIKNNKIYIGQTTKSLHERFQNHLSRMPQSDLPLYVDMRKYGIENFKIEIIETVMDANTLNEREQYYITKFHSNNPIYGYNILCGGHVNPMDNDAVKEKHLNTMQSDIVRSKISDTMKNNLHDETLKAKYCENLKSGFRAYVESGKYKEFRKTIHLSEEHKFKLNSVKFKSVQCVNISNNVIASFICVTDAAHWWKDTYKLTISIKSIMAKIKKSANEDIFICGLKWKYYV